jgi:hypothetical protein
MIRNLILSVGVVLGAAAVAALAQPAGTHLAAVTATAPVKPAERPMPEGARWGFFEQYCEKCHNSTDWAGGIAFDTMTPEGLGEDAKVWEEAVRKLRGRLMPPPGKAQPDQAAVDSLVSWLETRLDDTSAQHPDPGSVSLHRLNRTEYAREIQAILGLTVDAAALLPKDTKSDGFDNIATVLKVSPSFLDQYITAAHDVAAEAVGNAHAPPSSVVYRASRDVSQSQHIEGLPLGTRGGMLIEHLFPADGDYILNITQSAGFGGGYVTALDSHQELIVTLDGVRIFRGTLGGEADLKAVDQKQVAAVKPILDRFRNIPLTMKGGPHKIGLAFVVRSFAESDDTLQPLGSGAAGAPPSLPGALALEVRGPSHPTGLGETPSRRRIFICYPKSESEELPCAKQIIANLARRAYRRPVGDVDLAAPVRFYEGGRKTKGFEGGIQQALTAILASPKFLYRFEATPQNAVAGASYRIGELELASRLAFFLWSEGPDEELLTVAASGKLHDPAVLQEQVRRLLADPRSSALVTGFADEWLQVEDMEQIEPDPSLFAEFDGALRAAFKREIQLFVGSVFSENQSIVRLLDANYTFVNERLALHYGIPNVRGEQFRRVTLTDSNRFGLLGKASFLLGTSYANRTSPVKRGAWILETITGTPPHAPPPGVQALQENMEGQKALTVRQRMEAHRSNPSCNACHGILDPLGYSLENFDAIGAWRAKDRDAGTSIDAGGGFLGHELKGPDDLRKVLLARPQQFVQTLAEKLLTYALGRDLDYHDMPTVRAIVRQAVGEDYRFSAIVSGIVNSPQFQMQVVPAAGASPPIKQAQLTR